MYAKLEPTKTTLQTGLSEESVWKTMTTINLDELILPNHLLTIFVFRVTPYFSETHDYRSTCENNSRVFLINTRNVIAKTLETKTRVFMRQNNRFEILQKNLISEYLSGRRATTISVAGRNHDRRSFVLIERRSFL